MKKIYSLFTIIFALVLSGHAQVNPGICMVTVDDSSKHNIVYYDKTQLGVVDSFILWRESNTTPGNYARIMANSSSAYSMFLDMDTAGNPNVKLHRYKLQAYDAANGYSQLGPYHTVLYCLQNDSNYNWNQYDIEGVGTGSVNNYQILQDDNSTGLWHPVDTVSGSWSSWVDGAVILFPNGQWRLATLWGTSCTPNARYGNNSTQTIVVKSKSNITNNKTAGVSTFKSAGIWLFPNPAVNKVTLRLNFPLAQATSVKLYNALGVEVMQSTIAAGKDEGEINVSALPKGIYVAELINAGAKITKRLAVE